LGERDRPGCTVAWLAELKDVFGEDAGHGRRDARAPLFMVAVRKNLDLVWVWFYKDAAPTALFKGANPAK
jgi:hypothetical protein